MPSSPVGKGTPIAHSRVRPVNTGHLGCPEHRAALIVARQGVHVRLNAHSVASEHRRATIAHSSSAQGAVPRRARERTTIARCRLGRLGNP